MAIGEDNILEGLDLSVLDSITSSPKAEEKQPEAAGEETKTEDPGIFNPELKIQEVFRQPLVFLTKMNRKQKLLKKIQRSKFQKQLKQAKLNKILKMTAQHLKCSQKSKEIAV